MDDKTGSPPLRARPLVSVDQGLAGQVVAIVLLLALAVLLRDMLLMVLAATVFAVALGGATDSLSRRTGLGRGLALTLVGLALLVALAGLLYLFGSQLSAQLVQLARRVPETLARLQERFNVALSMEDLGQGPLADLGGRLVNGFAAAGGAVFGGVTDAVLILVAAAYIAAQPDLYRNGIMALVPQGLRADMAHVLDTTGHAWRQWFGAQLIAMALVGVLVAIGASLIGLPSPIALGLIAGLLEFVPIVGSILGAVPALLFAIGMGEGAFAWTLALFIAVQQIESNLVMPLLQQRIVSLPPALLLFAIVGAGALFGLMGLFVAAPLTILAYVLVVTFYVRNTLGEDAIAPGEADKDEPTD